MLFRSVSQSRYDLVQGQAIVVDMGDRYMGYGSRKVDFFVVLNVASNVLCILDLQFPREVKVAFVFKVNMQTFIALFVPKVPIL